MAVLCLEPRLLASVYDANVDGADWWQNSVWNGGIPGYQSAVSIPHSESRPLRAAYLSLPDPSIVSPGEIDAILRDWRGRVIGGRNIKTYILGDLSVTARGNPGIEHFMRNAGFINGLAEPGYNPNYDYSGSVYGLAAGNVTIGDSVRSGTARNDGYWRIEGSGGLNIYLNSVFTNNGYLDVVNRVTLQQNGRLVARSGLLTMSNGLIPTNGSMFLGESNGPSGRVEARGTLTSSGRIILYRRSELAANQLEIGGRLTTDFSTTGVGVGSTLRAQGRTLIAEAGSIELEPWDNFTTGSLDIRGAFKPSSARVAVSGTATVGFGREMTYSGRAFSAGTLLVQGTAVFQPAGGGGAPQSPTATFNQLEVSGGLVSLDNNVLVRTAQASAGQLGGGSASTSALILGAGAKLESTSGLRVGTSGEFIVNGNGALATAPTATLSGGGTGTARLEALRGGRLAVSGNLSTGTASGGSSTIFVNGLSRVEAKQVLLGASPSHDSSLTLSDGGTLTATDGILLNYGAHAANTATIVLGGQNPATGGYHDPGFLDTPLLVKTPSTGTATLRFMHGDAGGTLFWPELRGMNIIESTGPGRSVLRGRVTNTTAVRADAGTLVFAHGDAPNTLVLGSQVRGGQLVVDGCEVRVDPAGFSGSSVTSGTLSVVNGGKLTSALTVSGPAGSSAVVVDGRGSEILAQKSFMQIGYEGAQGRMEIRNQGVVTCDPASGTTLRVAGQANTTGNILITGSAELRANRISVGYQGIGIVDVENLGKILGADGGSSTFIHLGDQPGSRGVLRLRGLSEVRTNELRVGSLGTGLLELPTAGSVKITGPTIIGHSAEGVASIGPLSSLQADGGLTVGYNARGHLRLRGGSVRVGPAGQGALVLGETSYGDGSLWIEGPGGTLFASGVTTGEDGVGTIIFNHEAADLAFRTPINGPISLRSRAGNTRLDLPSAYVAEVEVSGGALRIANGTRFANYGFSTVGSTVNDGRTGLLAITGAGTVFESERNIEILERGRLHVSEGARVSVFEGGGRITFGRPASPGQAAVPSGALIVAGNDPGTLAVSSIRGLGTLEEEPEAGALVIFEHGSPRHEFNVPTEGNLSILQRGTGTTVLPGSMAHAGETMVIGGTLIVNGSVTNGTTRLQGGALGGVGSLRTIVVGANGVLSPGDPAADGGPVGSIRCTGVTTFGPGGAYRLEIGDWSGTTSGTHWDRLLTGSLINTATAANPFVIKISGPVRNFTETEKSMIIVQRSGSGAIPNATHITIDDSDFPGTGTWGLRRSSMYLYLDYTPGTETPYQEWARLQGLTAGNNAPGDDADKDGLPNFAEFALDENPRDGARSGKRDGGHGSFSGAPSAWLTVPVRRGAVFSGSPALLSGFVDGIRYRIEASDDLATWNTPVQELTGAQADAMHAAMPPLSNGNWTYRTFHTNGAASGRRFIRAVIDE